MAAISVFFVSMQIALMAPFKVKYSFYVWKRGHKVQFAWKQKNTKMAAILE